MIAHLRSVALNTLLLTSIPFLFKNQKLTLVMPQTLSTSCLPSVLYHFLLHRLLTLPSLMSLLQMILTLSSHNLVLLHSAGVQLQAWGRWYLLQTKKFHRTASTVLQVQGYNSTYRSSTPASSKRPQTLPRGLVRLFNQLMSWTWSTIISVARTRLVANSK
jgi:hypothetical protein